MKKVKKEKKPVKIMIFTDKLCKVCGGSLMLQGEASVSAGDILFHSKGEPVCDDENCKGYGGRQIDLSPVADLPKAVFEAYGLDEISELQGVVVENLMEDLDKVVEEIRGKVETMRHFVDFDLEDRMRKLIGISVRQQKLVSKEKFIELLKDNY